MSSFINWLQGNLDPSKVDEINSQVQAPNQSVYQIAGLPQYQTAMQNLIAQYGSATPDMSSYGNQYANAGADVTQALGNFGQQYGQLGAGYGQQMQGIGQQQAGLYGQVPQGPNLQGATAHPMGQLQQLQGYQQQIAMGQAPSAADQMLQNQMANLGRQTQSGIASAGSSMNPALALRTLFQNQSTQGANLGAAAAQQKLGEQAQFGQMAAQNANSLYGQNFNNAQQGFANQNQTYGNQMNNLAAQGQTAQAGFQGQMAATGAQSNVAQSMYQDKMASAQAQQAASQQNYINKMQTMQAQSDIASKIYQSNAQQATYNMDYQQNLQAYQMWHSQQQMQAAKDQARGQSALARALITGGLTAGGMAIGSSMGPMGAMAGGSLGGSLGSALTGGSGSSSGGGMDPYMLALMMKQNPSGAPPMGNPSQVVAGSGGSSGYTMSPPQANAAVGPSSGMPSNGDATGYATGSA